MNISIDWLSFTIPAEEISELRSSLIEYKLQSALGTAGIASLFAGWPDGTFQQENGRAPYAISFAGMGARIYVGKPTNILIELSGEGCKNFHPQLEGLLRNDMIQFTRIDLACDMECNTQPDIFVSSSGANKTSSRGSFRSKTGHTEYVGSQKSEQYARIYRYAEPHPRAKYLRAEFVFRRKHAQQIVKDIIEHGLVKVAVGVGSNKYKFTHPSWERNNANEYILNVSSKKKANRTVTWLISQCAPAFRRAVKEGAINDPYAFIREHFLGDTLLP